MLSLARVLWLKHWHRSNSDLIPPNPVCGRGRRVTNSLRTTLFSSTQTGQAFSHGAAAAAPIYHPPPHTAVIRAEPGNNHPPEYTHTHAHTLSLQKKIFFLLSGNHKINDRSLVPGIQGLWKAFRPLDFFHILLRYILILKCIKI